MRTLDVELGDRSYPIHVGAGLLGRAGELLADRAGGRGVIVTNPTVAAHHLQRLRTGLAPRFHQLDVVLLPDGESHKDWPALQDLVTRLLELRAERSTTLIALGGGVIGDIGGFAAAIYQRGMPFVQVPTTLLAQVDSSVGGKTGINHRLGKNMIGAFYQPRAVIIDTDCLRTLPVREQAAGFAEVVKYGAIHSAAFLAWLEANADALRAGDSDLLGQAIHESCRIKAAIVAGDEREAGERALLNFGHTFAHAIEAAAGYGTWLHGEAVGAGMVLAAKLSVLTRGLDQPSAQRLATLLRRFEVPLEPPRLALSRWLELMQRDKKVIAGRMRFILLEALGRAVIADDVLEADLARVLA